MKFKRVEGKDRGSIILFGLSTCVWCKKSKKMLDDYGVAYDYFFVDELEGPDQSQAIEELKKWNPLCSFPTLVIGEERSIVGYDEEKILEVIS